MTDLADAQIRLAILQRVCPAYRLALFRGLSTIPGLTVRLFIGDDLPESKVRSAAVLTGIDVVRLPTRIIRLRRRILPWHRGLVAALEEFQPDVILCEGESHILGYLQALWYRRRHMDVGLIHWGGGGLPGSRPNRWSARTRLITTLQNRFDVFLEYSSFGKDWLNRIGHDPEKIVVATNVTDTASHLEQAAAAPDSPEEARAKLGLPERFTVLYSGSMDPQKRPGLVLDIAAATRGDQCSFVLVGDGELLGDLRARAEREGLDNVFLPGRVSNELGLYYRASDAMILPGRGGMVISEAMAWALPVIVHQADGTEYDLVRDGKTGIHLQHGDIGDFRDAVESLRSDPTRARQTGADGKALLEREFTTENMLTGINTAVRMAVSARTRYR